MPVLYDRILPALFQGKGWQAAGGGGAGRKRRASREGNGLGLPGSDVSMCSVEEESPDGSQEELGLRLAKETAEPGLVAAGGWCPGWSVGAYIGRDRPLDAQAQVLVANVVLVLKQVPRSILRPFAEAVLPNCSATLTSLALRGAVGCLRLSGWRIYNALRELKLRQWVPKGKATASSRQGGTGPEPDPVERDHWANHGWAI